MICKGFKFCFSVTRWHKIMFYCCQCLETNESNNGTTKITVEPPLKANSLQHPPLYNGHFLLSPRWPFTERFDCTCNQTALDVENNAIRQKYLKYAGHVCHCPDTTVCTVSETSPLGHLYSRDTNFGPRKTLK